MSAFCSLCAPGESEWKRTCENVLEGKLDVAGVQGGRLDKGEVVFTWKKRPLVSLSCSQDMHALRTCKLLSLLCRHRPQMPQIALVSNQHDDDVRVSVVAQLFQPPCDVLVRLVLADVVDEQGADSTPVVGGCDGAVSLLAGGIPNLRLDGLRIDLDGPRGKLDADGRLGVKVKLVAGETTQKVGFTNTRVSDQDDYGGLARQRRATGGVRSGTHP